MPKYKTKFIKCYREPMRAHLEVESTSDLPIERLRKSMCFEAKNLLRGIIQHGPKAGQAETLWVELEIWQGEKLVCATNLDHSNQYRLIKWTKFR